MTLLTSPSASSEDGSLLRASVHPAQTRAPAAVAWSYTKAAQLLPQEPPRLGRWLCAGSVISGSGDLAPIGCEVLVQVLGNRTLPLAAPACSSNQEPTPTETAGANRTTTRTTIFASVIEILRSEDPARFPSWVVVRESNIQDSLHPVLKMPWLRRTGLVHLVQPEDILCTINVQHDCISAKCNIDGTQIIRQEREETSRTRAVLEHTNNIQYVINTHALHNQLYLRQHLPPALFEIPCFFADRPTLHRQAAESLRDTKLQKKLAREALIRKNAETALRSATSNPAHTDLLGLAEGAIGNETPARNVALQPDSHPSDRSVPLDLSRSAAQPQRGAEIVYAAPRGPRQRRAAPAARSAIPNGNPAQETSHAASTSTGRPVTHWVGHGTSGSGHSQAAVHASTQVDRGANPPSGVPVILTGKSADQPETPTAQALSANTVNADLHNPHSLPQPRPPKKRRTQPAADPIASAAREATFRALFQS
ncbi:hypothetical protein C8Q80DRAFT_428645 [Daedaleopsis nitida]|nr:hypothetical protein C8Q80DRAFT_428645 [Daedaleopsis nitida]